MASKTAILAAMTYLEGSGLPIPRVFVDPGTRDVAVAVWLEQLRYVSDPGLGEAVRRLAPQLRYWPSVGQVLAACPPPPPLLADECHEPHAYTDAPLDVRAAVLRRWEPDVSGTDDELWASLDDLTADVLAGR